MSKFSDTSDFATELEQRERDILLAQHKANAEPRLQPTGRCYNCELEISRGLFCCKDCQEEWDFIKKMEKHR